MYRRHCVWAVVLLVALGQVRSQSGAGDLLTDTSVAPRQHILLVPKGFINGPTGISVEAEHHRAAGVRDYVNGPTGTSVNAEEDRLQSDVMSFVNGTKGTSTATQGLTVEEIIAYEEEQKGVFTDLLKDNSSASVNGPTATSEDVPSTDGEADGGRTIGRGVYPTDPKQIVDDLAISGFRPKESNIPRAESESNVTTSQTPDTVPTIQDLSQSTQINNEENVTSKQTTESLGEVTGNDTTQHENSTVSEVSPSTNTENMTGEVSEKTDTTQGIVNTETTILNANGTEVVEEFDKGNNSAGDWVTETIVLSGPDDINVGTELGKVDNENFTADSLNTGESIIIDGEAQGRNASNPSENMDITIDETDEFSITPGSNMTAEGGGTVVPSPTAETGLTGEDNQTQIISETTSSTGNTGEPIDDNTTSSLTPSQPPTLDTGNATQTSTSQNPDNINNTFIPSESQQPEEGKTSSRSSTTSLGVTTTGIYKPISTEIVESTNASTLPIFPSGVPTTNITTTINGTNTPVVMSADTSITSWRVFQVFLGLCTLGLLGLGFLYWRKKRRQDDEIPMFTRQSHTDYHNPTFSVDDDASFMSRGSRHNYKSFE